MPSFPRASSTRTTYDGVVALRPPREVDFDGFPLDDHVPHVIDDTPWAHRGRAHAVGSLRGTLAATRSR